MSIREDLLAMMLDGGGGSPSVLSEIEIVKAWQFGDTEWFFGVTGYKTPIKVDALQMSKNSEIDHDGNRHTALYRVWNLYNGSCIGKILGDKLMPIAFSSDVGGQCTYQLETLDENGQLIEERKFKSLSVGNIVLRESYGDFSFSVDTATTTTHYRRFDLASGEWYIERDDDVTVTNYFNGYLYGNQSYETRYGTQQCPEHWRSSRGYSNPAYDYTNFMTDMHKFNIDIAPLVGGGLEFNLIKE